MNPTLRVEYFWNAPVKCELPNSFESTWRHSGSSGVRHMSGSDARFGQPWASLPTCCVCCPSSSVTTSRQRLTRATHPMLMAGWRWSCRSSLWLQRAIAFWAWGARLKCWLPPRCAAACWTLPDRSWRSMRAQGSDGEWGCEEMRSWGCEVVRGEVLRLSKTPIPQGKSPGPRRCARDIYCDRWSQKIPRTRRSIGKRWFIPFGGVALLYLKQSWTEKSTPASKKFAPCQTK